MSRLTNFPNGLGSFFVDIDAETKTTNYTVIIDDDAGKTFSSIVDGIVFSLPSISIGNTITFVNMAPDGTAEMRISPTGPDAISWVSSSVDGKDLINTKATQKQGDSVTIASLTSGIRWEVVSARGVWAKEA